MNPLVAPSWLAARLADPNVVILDATLPPVGVTPPVDVRSRYLAKHLPGAIFFDIEELSDHASGLPHTMPTAEAFSRNLSAMGIGREMTIVVYEQEGVFSAPRGWWMLRLAGAEKVYLLDGGLRAWVDAGLPTEAGEIKRAPASFEAAYPVGAMKDFAEVQELIAGQAQGGTAQGGTAQILDARSAGRFSGAAPEPRPGLSSGHMPGAVSMPFLELVRDGRLKPAEELAGIFAEKKVDLSAPITTSCGSGVTAAVVSLGLEICGADQVSLYDGSWAEYAQKPEAVIIKDV